MVLENVKYVAVQVSLLVGVEDLFVNMVVEVVADVRSVQARAVTMKWSTNKRSVIVPLLKP